MLLKLINQRAFTNLCYAPNTVLGTEKYNVEKIHSSLVLRILQCGDKY